MKTSIIIPTYDRPAQLRRCVERLIETTNGLRVEIVVVAEVNPDSIPALDDLSIINDGQDLMTYYHDDWRGSVANWNLGAAMATGDLLVTGADDLWWNDRWLHNTHNHLEMTGTCYTGLNDLMFSGWDHNPTHWAITRQGILDFCGGCLMPPCYKTTFPDNEVAARIKRAGQYTWCAEAVVEHRHFSVGKSKHDKCYLTMTKHFWEDEKTFNQRQAAGFPDDFEAVVQ